MPRTLTGWLLFAIIMACGCASIAMAVKLIISGLGKASQGHRDFQAAFIVGLLLVVATVLFIWIEPMPV